MCTIKNLAKLACFIFFLLFSHNIQTWASTIEISRVTPEIPVLLSDQIVVTQYKITNHSKNAQSLYLVPRNGIRQLEGKGLCSVKKGFWLQPEEFCYMNLEVTAAKISGKTLITPRICDVYSFSCYFPKKEERLKTDIQACDAQNCLPEKKTQALRQATLALKNQYDIPGIIAGVWVGNKSYILEEGYSEIQTARPVHRAAHTRIGSITKSFTVVSMLDLIRQGLISLNTHVSDFYPQIHNNNAHMKELADMRSGIYNYTEDQAFLEDFINEHKKVRNPEDVVPVANRNQPYFSPGTDWHYSNTNTVLVGLIIEHLTQKSLEKVVSEFILLPLGLKETSFSKSLEIPEPYLHGYAFEPRLDVTGTDSAGTGGSGAMISTLEDLHTWSVALGKGKLVSAELFQETLNSLQPVTSFPCPDTQANRQTVHCPEYDRYGMGIGEIAGWIGHTAEFVGYTSLIMYHPATESSVVILMNISMPEKHLPTELFRQFVEILNSRDASKCIYPGS